MRSLSEVHDKQAATFDPPSRPSKLVLQSEGSLHNRLKCVSASRQLIEGNLNAPLPNPHPAAESVASLGRAASGSTAATSDFRAAANAGHDVANALSHPSDASGSGSTTGVLYPSANPVNPSISPGPKLFELRTGSTPGRHPPPPMGHPPPPPAPGGRPPPPGAESPPNILSRSGNVIKNFFRSKWRNWLENRVHGVNPKLLSRKARFDAEKRKEEVPLLARIAISIKMDPKAWRIAEQRLVAFWNVPIQRTKLMFLVRRFKRGWNRSFLTRLYKFTGDLSVYGVVPTVPKKPGFVVSSVKLLWKHVLRYPAKLLLQTISLALWPVMKVKDWIYLGYSKSVVSALRRLDATRLAENERPTADRLRRVNSAPHSMDKFTPDPELLNLHRLPDSGKPESEASFSRWLNNQFGPKHTGYHKLDSSIARELSAGGSNTPGSESESSSIKSGPASVTHPAPRESSGPAAELENAESDANPNAPSIQRANSMPSMARGPTAEENVETGATHNPVNHDAENPTQREAPPSRHSNPDSEDNPSPTTPPHDLNKPLNHDVGASSPHLESQSKPFFSKWKNKLFRPKHPGSRDLDPFTTRELSAGESNTPDSARENRLLHTVPASITKVLPDPDTMSSSTTPVSKHHWLDWVHDASTPGSEEGLAQNLERSPSSESLQDSHPVSDQRESHPSSPATSDDISNPRTPTREVEEPLIHNVDTSDEISNPRSPTPEVEEPLLHNGEHSSPTVESEVPPNPNLIAPTSNAEEGIPNSVSGLNSQRPYGRIIQSTKFKKKKIPFENPRLREMLGKRPDASTKPALHTDEFASAPSLRPEALDDESLGSNPFISHSLEDPAYSQPQTSPINGIKNGETTDSTVDVDPITHSISIPNHVSTPPESGEISFPRDIKKPVGGSTTPDFQRKNSWTSSFTRHGAGDGLPDQTLTRSSSLGNLRDDQARDPTFLHDVPKEPNADASTNPVSTKDDLVSAPSSRPEVLNHEILVSNPPSSHHLADLPYSKPQTSPFTYLRNRETTGNNVDVNPILDPSSITMQAPSLPDSGNFPLARNMEDPIRGSLNPTLQRQESLPSSFMGQVAGGGRPDRTLDRFPSLDPLRDSRALGTQLPQGVTNKPIPPEIGSINEIPHPSPAPAHTFSKPSPLGSPSNSHLQNLLFSGGNNAQTPGEIMMSQEPIVHPSSPLTHALLQPAPLDPPSNPYLQNSLFPSGNNFPTPAQIVKDHGSQELIIHPNHPSAQPETRVPTFSTPLRPSSQSTSAPKILLPGLREMLRKPFNFNLRDAVHESGTSFFRSLAKKTKPPVQKIKDGPPTVHKEAPQTTSSIPESSSTHPNQDTDVAQVPVSSSYISRLKDFIRDGINGG
ncbi:hypothetical protein PCANC_18746 [Puccinia coronata f. sp. avenae]|uniref:Uncharacterized protein n=1 Tax=Puccinia coronata f. sp. avenae TaxID=200324 RepID=A0A2N5SLF0_9BASI|nr:hypothetical protein PCANC_18746 [Puccinia coronata f. sp. avenae]